MCFCERLLRVIRVHIYVVSGRLYNDLSVLLIIEVAPSRRIRLTDRLTPSSI